MAFTKEDELLVCADWDKHLFSQDWLLTFCSAICADAPSNRLERAHRRGALQHAHLPLSPQFAVPCGAPDVACRIIHNHALMKVSIWPHMHTLSPQNQICMGKLGEKNNNSRVLLWYFSLKHQLLLLLFILLLHVLVETLKRFTGDAQVAVAKKVNQRGTEQYKTADLQGLLYMNNASSTRSSCLHRPASSWRFSNHSERSFRAFFCRAETSRTFFEDGRGKGLIASQGLTQ